MDIAPVRAYFTGLQDRIVGELEAIEGAHFLPGRGVTLVRYAPR
jgi:hypothetical protein